MVVGKEDEAVKGEVRRKRRGKRTGKGNKCCGEMRVRREEGREREYIVVGSEGEEGRGEKRKEDREWWRGGKRGENGREKRNKKLRRNVNKELRIKRRK